MANQSVYERNGYLNRTHYLDSIAEDNGLNSDDVHAVADMLGPSEDFDGLLDALDLH